jgi:hypothetical protein
VPAAPALQEPVAEAPAGGVDSFALMRELSSLSQLHDEATDAPSEQRTPAVTRPVSQPSPDKSKKKRGLFGR